jgi:hypothetical protein
VSVEVDATDLVSSGVAVTACGDDLAAGHLAADSRIDAASAGSPRRVVPPDSTTRAATGLWRYRTCTRQSKTGGASAQARKLSRSIVKPSQASSSTLPTKRSPVSASEPST